MGRSSHPPATPSMTLAQVVEQEPSPINAVSVVRRVIFLFGSQSRYPAWKMVLCGKAEENGDEETRQKIADLFERAVQKACVEGRGRISEVVELMILVHYGELHRWDDGAGPRNLTYGNYSGFYWVFDAIYDCAGSQKVFGWCRCFPRLCSPCGAVCISDSVLICGRLLIEQRVYFFMVKSPSGEYFSFLEQTQVMACDRTRKRPSPQGLDGRNCAKKQGHVDSCCGPPDNIRPTERIPSRFFPSLEGTCGHNVFKNKKWHESGFRSDSS